MAGTVLVLAATTATLTPAPATPPVQPELMVAGVAQDPCQPLRVLPVPVQLAGHFEPDSSILRTAGGVYAAPGRPARLTRPESPSLPPPPPPPHASPPPRLLPPPPPPHRPLP